MGSCFGKLNNTKRRRIRNGKQHQEHDNIHNRNLEGKNNQKERRQNILQVHSVATLPSHQDIFKGMEIFGRVYKIHSSGRSMSIYGFDISDSKKVCRKFREVHILGLPPSCPTPASSGDGAASHLRPHHYHHHHGRSQYTRDEIYQVLSSLSDRFVFVKLTGMISDGSLLGTVYLDIGKEEKDRPGLVDCLITSKRAKL